MGSLALAPLAGAPSGLGLASHCSPPTPSTKGDSAGKVGRACWQLASFRARPMASASGNAPKLKCDPPSPVAARSVCIDSSSESKLFRSWRTEERRYMTVGLEFRATRYDR